MFHLNKNNLILSISVKYYFSQKCNEFHIKNFSFSQNGASKKKTENSTLTSGMLTQKRLLYIFICYYITFSSIKEHSYFNAVYKKISFFV